MLPKISSCIDVDIKIKPLSNKILCARLDDLLQAALNAGPDPASAYYRWRSAVSIKDIDFTVFRLLPLLVETILRYKISEPELPRIKGAAKHTWLKNVTRASLLIDALEVLNCAGVKTMIMKGAALFARFPELGSMRGCGDYDILVHRREAIIATRALLSAGFHVDGVRMDLFVSSDFDKIHGMHFGRDISTDTIDVHWWPLPDWFDTNYIDDLFSRMEPARLLGRTVMVPRIDDHLFLTGKRVRQNDEDEIILRTVESALLLRACRGLLNWENFKQLTIKYQGAAGSSLIFQILDRLGNFSIPATIIDELEKAGVRELVPAISCQESLVVDKREIWRNFSAKEISFSADNVVYLKGFSFPETFGRWTNGRFAVVAIKVNAVGPVYIDLELRPFIPPGAIHLSFSLYAGGNDDISYTLNLEEDLPSRITIKANALQRPVNDSIIHGERSQSCVGIVTIVFELTDPRSPMELGLCPDPRCLGLMLSKIRHVNKQEKKQLDRLAEILAAPNVDMRQLWEYYAEKETVFFSETISYLYGFSTQEASGRWTNGSFAILAIKVNVIGSVCIELEVRPFIPPGTKQFSFSLFSGIGNEISYTLGLEDEYFSKITILTTSFQRRETGLLRDIKETEPNTGIVILAFKLIDAGSPFELGLSNDLRRLGLLVGKSHQVVCNS